jgi:uncharacterized protein
MGVSRQTIGRMLEEARKKVVTALLEGRVLRIEGGNYTMVQSRAFNCDSCGRPTVGRRSRECPACKGAVVRRSDMIPAVDLGIEPIERRCGRGCHREQK